MIWCTWAGESPAAAASVQIETPSVRAEASAQARSRSACSRRHAAWDTRASTCRSRRQAPIRSVIVTMTPLQEFSELDGQRRFVAPLLPAPRDLRQEHLRDLPEFDQLEIEQFFLIY